MYKKRRNLLVFTSCIMIMAFIFSFQGNFTGAAVNEKNKPNCSCPQKTNCEQKCPPCKNQDNEKNSVKDVVSRQVKPKQPTGVKEAPRVDRTDFPALYLTDPCIQGESVWMVQARLRELGYDIIPDGVYSPATAQTVRLFQIAHGLKDDGIVSEPVWKALMFSPEAEACISDKGQEKEARMLIVIDVATRKLTLYDENNKVVKEYPVA
ncbi:L,D-transpeptidase family protein [Syntrophomonas palmitatica]|uniref:L,D-transpeptidase family protein n=1 Tax=Syntrophomonas palmitatica TaxID=402877 RepID=UPI0006D158AF|nr:L,D-transpeptidase family protein [Syntrophomonas palmitatica]